MNEGQYRLAVRKNLPIDYPYWVQYGRYAEGRNGKIRWSTKWEQGYKTRGEAVKALNTFTFDGREGDEADFGYVPDSEPAYTARQRR